jgi:hypothetical protein
MNKKVEKPGMDELRGTHANAILAFNAASATLILRFAANLPPSDEQIAAEEEARARVVATRRDLWGAQRLSGRPIGEPGEETLPELYIGTQQVSIGD